MYDLSILIPARNEEFLAKTVENILENIKGKTEVIVVLDGAWANPPVKDDPRVRIIYFKESRGQRAATNAACRLSKAKYIMKVDAHCAFSKGFDVKMMEYMKDDITMVPRMKNLHAFDWVCDKCGTRLYQGPTPKKCEFCDGKMVKTMVWEGKRSPNSTSYCFDSTPHFQYFKEFEKRDEFINDFKNTGITETMSLQGSCFMLTRDKYWELNICDERFGSWGSQGIEVACKTWLSGGRVVCNHHCWYAHMFRTQGGDFGFPYPLPGSQVKNARNMAKSLFLDGNWGKQIYPLSWLLKKFAPVPGWTEESLRVIYNLGDSFSTNPIVSIPTKSIANSTPSSVAKSSQNMPSNTTCLSEINSGRANTSVRVSYGENKLKMSKVTTTPVITNMINLGNSFTDTSGNGLNKESIQKTVDSFSMPIIQDSSISITSKGISQPYPTPGFNIDFNINDNFIDNSGAKRTNSEKIGSHMEIISQANNPSKGIIFYTDNQLSLKIAHKVQKQLLSIGLPIVSASLKPMSFGNNIYVPLKRGYLTMFKQILIALENSTTDIVYFCEHDVLYHPSHFKFTPEKKDIFYYNENVWKVKWGDTHALHYDCQQLSGLCCYRELAIEHYRRRIIKLESFIETINKVRPIDADDQINKYVRAIGFEPGTHRRESRVDNYRSVSWKSEYPNVDIRHDNNLTASRWKKEQFRNQSNTKGWLESENIPGWSKL